jgi:hypothetical protein
MPTPDHPKPQRPDPGSTLVQNEQSSPPSAPPENRPDTKRRSKGGLRFIGMELTIFSAAILIFVIAIVFIVFMALSR